MARLLDDREMTKVTLRISMEVRERIKTWAKRAGVSEHAYMRQSLLIGSVEQARRLGVYHKSDTDLET